MRRYSGQGATIWAGALVVIGFGVIALAWRGAAATMFVPTQLAFAVSGGMVGLGLIGAGGALLSSQIGRVGRADASYELEQLTTQTAQLLEELRRDRDTAR